VDDHVQKHLTRLQLLFKIVDLEGTELQSLVQISVALCLPIFEQRSSVVTLYFLQDPLLERVFEHPKQLVTSHPDCTLAQLVRRIVRTHLGSTGNQ